MPNVQKKGLSSMTARNKYCRIAMDGPQLEPPARHLLTMPTRPMVLSLVGLMFFPLLFGCASTGAVKQEPCKTMRHAYPEADTLWAPHRRKLETARAKVLDYFPDGLNVTSHAWSVDSTINGLAPARDEYANVLLEVEKALAQEAPSTHRDILRLLLVDEVLWLQRGQAFASPPWDGCLPRKYWTENLELHERFFSFTAFPTTQAYFKPTHGQNYNTSAVLATAQIIVAPFLAVGSVLFDVVMFPTGYWWWINGGSEPHLVPGLPANTFNRAVELYHALTATISDEDMQREGLRDLPTMHRRLVTKLKRMGTIPDAILTADENGNQEIRFTGTIRNIHFGVPFDAQNQILVDAFGEKLVIFGSGGSRGRQPELPWGRLVGFDFPDSIGSDDFSGYNQTRVHVYCAVDFASGPNMEKVPIYTLYGKKDYFVCLSREDRGCPE